MINKKAFIFDTVAEALAYKISADPKNTTYRLGSFSEYATIHEGEPDIPYYSEILIREIGQTWRCNQFWGYPERPEVPQGDYSFVFLEEDVIDNLTAENTQSMTLYFGLEEDDEGTETTHATYDKGYCSADVTYSNGYAAVGGSYDKGFVSI